MNPYLNVWATMMNVVKKFSDDNPAYALSVMDFDENVSENEYPAGNLGGIFQLEYMEDTSMIEVNCVFSFSTPLDVPVHELNKLVGEVVSRLRYDSRHPFYDYASSQQIGLMTAGNDLKVSPVVTTEVRKFKHIMQTFRFDRTSAFLPT